MFIALVLRPFIFLSSSLFRKLIRSSRRKYQHVRSFSLLIAFLMKISDWLVSFSVIIDDNISKQNLSILCFWKIVSFSLLPALYDYIKTYLLRDYSSDRIFGLIFNLSIFFGNYWI